MAPKSNPVSTSMMTWRVWHPYLAIACAVATGACAPVLSAGTPAPAGSAFDSFFDDPALAHAHWGVLVESLDDGATLYARDAEKLFLPASNVKVLTGAAALETLGPEYRFVTTVSAGGAVRDGVLDGSIVVTGTGDPSLSGRFLTDPRDVFAAWADSLRARGITRVVGGVIAVDTAFTDPTLGAGWMWDDLAFGSAAEFGALQFNEGIVAIDVFPSQNVLDPGIVVLDPPTQYVRIINDTRTMPEGSVTAIRVTRDDAGSTVVVRGEIAADSDGVTEVVAVRNPALYFASALRETLRDAGISVEGPAVHYSAVGILNGAIQQAYPMFAHRSPPLAEILPAMMKPSQNQLAETLLRAVGREMRGEGSAAGGVAVIDSLLIAWDIEERRMRMVDGSGMSRYNLLSPRLLTEVLVRMDSSANRDLWLESLAVAGRDGTLENRMRDAPLVDQVHAKTGTLSGVRSLSGYLTTRSGRRLVFSTIINNSVAGAAAADAAVEAMLEHAAVNY